MKIEHLDINNYKQFSDLKLDFTYPLGHEKHGEPLDKICIIGQSGTGKTNLLDIIKTAHDVGALILIDEAYYPLYPISVANLIEKYNNLVVIRSFSKAWGAAGLRVGYAMANKKLISLIHKQRPMYEIGNVSAKALEILLDYEDNMRLSVKRINDGKKYFQDAMINLGLSTYASYGNFLHIKFGKYADKIHKILDDKVYYRKEFNVVCLEDYSRFSATTIENFKPIVKLIDDIINQYNKESKK